MSVEWIAFKADGEKLISTETTFDKLPMSEIVGFSVVTKKSSMYVNLANGKLAKNGRVFTSDEAEKAKIKHLASNPKLKLFYSKRAYVDFNVLNGETTPESLEYVVCGWQTYTLKVYLKMIFPTEEIEIEIREIA